MSCGMSPAVFQMIEEMKKKQETSSAAQQPKNTTRKQRQYPKGEEEDCWDWTKTYDKWADYEDPEDIEAEKQKEQDKLDSQAKRAAMGGCNHDHSAEREVMEKSTELKFKECAMFSAEGNAWFQEGQFFRAGERFRKVLVWLDYTFPDLAEDQAKLEQLQMSAHLNLAVCKLRLGDWEEVLSSTYQVLNVEPHNVKALYTRGKVYRIKHEFDTAKELFLKALKHDPMNCAVRRELAFLTHQRKTYNLDTKRRAKAMFQFSDGSKKKSLSTTSRVDYLAPFLLSPQGNQESDEHMIFDDITLEHQTDDERLIGGNRGCYRIEDLIDFDVEIPILS